MKLSDFFQPGPQISPPEYGPEPSLYRVLVHYYESHDTAHHNAVKLANDYIASAIPEHT